MYINDQYIGQIKKEFTLFKPSFILDCNNWQITGDFLEWNYEIIDDNGVIIATVNALYVLMIVLAIDAQKCSNNG